MSQSGICTIYLILSRRFERSESGESKDALQPSQAQIILDRHART
jgi:hypothetical protein